MSKKKRTNISSKIPINPKILEGIILIGEKRYNTKIRNQNVAKIFLKKNLIPSLVNKNSNNFANKNGKSLTFCKIYLF